MIAPVIVPTTLKEVLSWFIKKPPLILEKKLTNYFQAGALLTSSGRSALLVLLEAYGLKKDDEIAVPAFGCPEVNQILIDAGYQINFAISQKTKVILVTHLFGNPTDVSAIKKKVAKKKIIILESVAQAIGAELNGQKLGTLADAAYGSFGYGKIITTINGGFILTRDQKIYQKCQKIINNFRKPTLKMELKRLLKLKVYWFLQNRFIYGLMVKFLPEGRFAKEINLDNVNFQFSPRQTLMGISQLKKLDFFNQKREKNIDFLRQNLKNVIHPEILANAKPIFLRYPIRFPNQAKRDKIKAKLYQKGIRASITYPSKTMLMLPSHPLVREKDLKIMAKVIND